MRPGIVHAWFASLTELGAGVMLLLGFATPLACAGVIGTMVVAWITNHRDKGFFVFHRPTEGYEYVMVLTLTAIGLAGIGAGQWSLDHAFGWFEPPGWWGFGIGVVAGMGGALSLLVVFWRPNQPAAAS
jgi:putative oxidoreductase